MTLPDDTNSVQIPSDLPDNPTLSYFNKPAAAGEDPTHLPDELTLSVWRLQPGATLPETVPATQMEEGEAPSYRLMRVIGAGGMGEVWEALQVSLGRTVAVKRVRPMNLRADNQQESLRKMREFRQEAIIAARLEHPNIVPVHDLGEDPDGQPLLAMKLVHGKPWDELLTNDFAKLSVPDFLGRHLPTLISVSQAVAFAHSRGVVHRDLKPSQVMVGEFGEVLLMDWGLALVVDEARGEAPAGAPQFHLPTRQSATNPSGTPAFMAPEQTHATAEKIGTWTDVYLLGGILYYLLTGHAPHEGRTAQQAFVNACHGRVINPMDRVVGRDVPAELAGVAMHTLSKETQDRVPSATAFVGLIQDYITGATKRRESIALVQQVQAALATNELGYGALSECDNKLVHALGLWPENSDIGPLRDVVLEKYAREAIGNNDLVLARVQAERIPDQARRQSLVEDIDVRAARESRNKRQRQQLIAATVVLLFVVGLSLFFVRDNYMKAERTRRELELAKVRTDLANQKKKEEQRRAELLSRINDLRRKEVDLAQRIDLQIPPPRDIRRFRQTDATELSDLVSLDLFEDAGAEAQRRRLIEERDILGAERLELTKLVGDALEPPPFALLIADANLAMMDEESPTSAMTAYKLYEEAAEKEKALPDPVIGMGLAALAADNPTSATQLLDRATQLAEAAWGAESPRFAELLTLQGRVHSQLDFNDPEAVKYFTQSLDIMLPQWAIMSADVAGRVRDKGDYRNAAGLVQSVYNTVVAQYGEDDPRSIRVSSNVAGILNEAGDYAGAAERYKRLAEMYEKERGVTNQAAIKARAFQGFNLARAGEHQKAKDILSQAVVNVQSAEGEKLDTLRAQVYAHYASVVEDMNEDIEAEKHYRMALESAKAASPGSPRLASYYSALGNSLNQMHRYDEALKEYQNALEAVTIPGVPDGPLALSTLHGLAITYMHLKRFEEAEEINRRIMTRRIESLGEDNPNTLNSMVNLAVSLSNQGKLDEALSLVEKAEAGYRRRYGDENADLAQILMNKRLILDRMGRTEEGIENIREAIEINTKVFGQDNEVLVGCHESLAHALTDMHDGEGAVAAYREAIRISEIIEGPDGATPIHLRVEQTNAFYALGDYQDAAANAQEAYELARAHLPEEDRSRIQSIHNLALSYDYLKDYTKSEPYHREVVAIRERVLGAENMTTATSIFNLGCNLLMQERYAEAETFLKKASEVFAATYPPSHPNNISALGMMAELKLGLGDLAGAAAITVDRYSRIASANRLKSASTARSIGWMGGVLADNGYDEAALDAKKLSLTIYAEGNGGLGNGDVRRVVYDVMEYSLPWSQESPDKEFALWLLSAAKTVDDTNRKREEFEHGFVLNDDNQGLLLWHVATARALQVAAPEQQAAIRSQLLRAHALAALVKAPGDNELVSEFMAPMIAEVFGSEEMPPVPPIPEALQAGQYPAPVLFEWLDSYSPPVDWASLNLLTEDQILLDAEEFDASFERLLEELKSISNK